MMDGSKIVYYIVLLMLQLIYSHVSAKQNYLISEGWILQNMPYISTIFATSKYLPDGPCREDTQKYLHHLLNGSAWAVQMFDSSTKYPEGILYGHTRHLGNFDECYNLHVNIAEENVNIREINGKYCLINIEYNNKHAIHQKLSVPKHQSGTLDTNTSFWEVVEQLEDSLHVSRKHLQLALCVPATCNEENVEIALGIPLKKLATSKNIELQTVQSISCQTSKDAPKYTLGAGIYCAVLLIILSLVITSTWYDNILNKNGNYASIINNIVLHFSARRNYAKITHVYDTGLDCIYCIRLFIVIYTVYLHYLITYIYNPIINTADFEKMFYTLSMLTNAIFVINIFLALGGILAAYQLLNDLDQHKKLYFIKNVATRYLRFTPLYAILIGFYIWIFPLLGSGPYWYLVIEQCIYCTKNWWMSLLYINNYAAPSELCIFHSWYLIVDFQLFVCSQFVIYVFWYIPRRIGYTFLGILTLISCTASFVATYTYGASSILRITPYITKPTDLPEFAAYYIKGHICATGYLVGIIAGAILHDHKGSKWRLSNCKFWSHMLVYSIVLYILALYWSNKFFILDKKNLLEEAIFAFFQRLISSLCICFVIILFSVDSHLKSYLVSIPRWVKSLSNLGYGVYMTNMILITYDIGQTRTAKTYSILKSIWDTIPILIISFLLSLLLGIYIEMPFGNLAKWLFSKNNKIALKRNDTIVVNERSAEDKVIKKD